MQFVPHVGAAARGAQPGDAQRGAVPVGQFLEVVELVDIVTGHHDRDLGVAEPRGAQVLQRPHRHRERARAADGVVDLGRRAVE